MSTYPLITNATAIGTVATLGVQPVGRANQPPASQTFELSVTGNGAVSATVQIVATNDPQALTNPTAANWSPYGSTFTATGTNSAGANQGGSQAWTYFGAYVTAISGTNATVNVRMSA